MRKKRSKDKWKYYKSIIGKSMIVIMIFLTATIACGMGYGYTLISKINAKDFPIVAIEPEKNDPINILVAGMDIGDTENLDNKEARRTDTIMVVNYNPLNNKMNVVSIPRDTMIEVDAYDGNGEYQGYWKINSAYALGGEEELINQVEGILDIKINYMVEVDYEGFRDLIDAIGGVEMYIKQDMFYDDDEQNLHINFNKGETVNLDGKKAEEFFRWRQNNDGTGFENGDLDRIKNQQILIGKIVEKCLNPLIVFKLPKIFNAITSNVNTNMPANKIIGLGLKVIKLNQEDIIMTSIKGYFQDIEGQSFIVSDKEANEELINSLKTSSTYKESINKSNIKVMILNGTNKNGLANTLKLNLYDLGYGTVNTANTDVVEKSVLQIDSNKDIAEVLKEDTGISKVDKIVIDEYRDYDVVIVIGEDKIDYFKGKQYTRS